MNIKQFILFAYLFVSMPLLTESGIVAYGVCQTGCNLQRSGSGLLRGGRLHLRSVDVWSWHTCCHSRLQHGSGFLHGHLCSFVIGTHSLITIINVLHVILILTGYSFYFKNINFKQINFFFFCISNGRFVSV